MSQNVALKLDLLGNGKEEGEFARHRRRCGEKHFMLKAQHVQWHRVMKGLGRLKTERSCLHLRQRLTWLVHSELAPPWLSRILTSCALS